MSGISPAPPLWKHPLAMPLALGVLVMTPLLFVGGPDYFAPRSWRAAWQFGHALLFACIGGLLALWRTRSPRALPAMLKLFGAAALGALLLGALVEWLQQLVPGREVSALDVRGDVLGMLLGFALLARATPGAAQHARRAVAVIALVGVVYSDLRPLAIALLDESAARGAFPVLADFETSMQAGRFSAAAAPRIVASPAGPNTTRVLRVELHPAQYSGFALKHFPRDWRGFRTLSFEVYREGGGPERITCRINDRAHETDNRFSDRYNGRFELQPGWNRVVIDLDAVGAAPAERAMNMGDITGLGCFATALRQSASLHIDDWALGGGVVRAGPESPRQGIE